MRLILTFAAICAVVASATAPVFAQQDTVSLSLTSYNDLVNRITQLENQQNSIMVSQSYVPVMQNTSSERGIPYVMFESVFMTPFQSRNTAAFVGDTDPDTGDTRNERSFEYDLEFSPRIEIGYMAPSNRLGWRARYWHFDADANFDMGTLEGAEIAFSDDPDVEIDDADTFVASSTIRMNVLDLEATKRLGNNLQISGGARISRIDHHNRWTADDNVLSMNSRFEGVGPTMALEVLHPISNSGLSLFGSLRGSVLFGSSSLAALSDEDTEGLVYSNNQDLVPVGDMQLGVQWESQTSNGVNLFARVAAEGQWWINGGASAPATDEDNDHFLGGAPTEPDLGFAGFSVSVGLSR